MHMIIPKGSIVIFFIKFIFFFLQYPIKYISTTDVILIKKPANPAELNNINLIIDAVKSIDIPDDTPDIKVAMNAIESDISNFKKGKAGIIGILVKKANTRDIKINTIF